jgi:hypothetical protein
MNQLENFQVEYTEIKSILDSLSFKCGNVKLDKKRHNSIVNFFRKYGDREFYVVLYPYKHNCQTSKFLKKKCKCESYIELCTRDAIIKLLYQDLNSEDKLVLEDAFTYLCKNDEDKFLGEKNMPLNFIKLNGKVLDYKNIIYISKDYIRRYNYLRSIFIGEFKKQIRTNVKKLN